MLFFSYERHLILILILLLILILIRGWLGRSRPPVRPPEQTSKKDTSQTKHQNSKVDLYTPLFIRMSYFWSDIVENASHLCMPNIRMAFVQLYKI